MERWDISASEQVNSIPKQDCETNALSKESPRHNNSSMFLVMILVTSCKSPFSLSRFDSDELAAAVAVRVSWYSRAVFDMNVSEVISQLCNHELEKE